MFEEIWLDIQTRVGTPHKIQRKSSVDGWVGGWLHRLCGPLHRLCGIGCTGYVVCCTGYVGLVAQAMWFVAQAMWACCTGYVAGPVIIVPLRGSILQAETCQISA